MADKQMEEAIRFIEMDEICKPAQVHQILDIIEQRITFRKDGKFSKETQDLFEMAIRRAKNGSIVIMEHIMREKKYH